MVTIYIEEVVFETIGWVWGVRVFLDEIERVLPNAEQNERDKLIDLANRVGWKEVFYFEKSFELHSKWDFWIPRVLSYSLITLLNSVVEAQLTSLCRRLRELHIKPLKINEIYGDPIDRAKTYLTKVIELNVGSDSDWETLRDLAKLRHAIVHSGGNVETETMNNKEEILRLVDKYSPELETLGGYLLPALSLCRRFLDAVESFFKNLFFASGLPEDAHTAEDKKLKLFRTI